jgi:hypothetical protein
VRKLTSNVVLLFLVVYALLGVYGALSVFWQPPGTLGFAPDYGSTVRAVSPGGPAALAGVVPGDRIRIAAASFDDRRYLAGSRTNVPIGQVVHVPLTHAGRDRDVALTSVPHVMAGSERTALLLLCVASLISIGIGASLIGLRPSLATWGFGLYCLLVLPNVTYPFPLSTADLAFSATVLYDVLQNLGVVGLLLFALEFPSRFDLPWRQHVRRALPAIYIVLTLMTLYPDVANQLLGHGAQFENRVLQVVFGAVFALAIGILWDTYRHVASDERERMRWVLIGFGAGLLISYIGETLIFSTLIAAAPPPWLSMTLTTLSVLLPLAVAHAVIRHRVLDIRFVIGRALVFAVLTTLLAAIFALLDYLFGTLLEDFRLSRVIAAGLSLTLAFAFKWLEERASRTIEAVFFRKRHAAEEHLSRAAHALPQARSAAVIEETLVGEVVAAYELMSAALFRRGTGDRFMRTAAYAWAGGDTAELDETDPLLLALRAENRVIDVGEFGWRRTDVPQGERETSFAVPIHLHAELIGFTLYGNHAGGSLIDPKERELLERLAYAAGLAYDQLEAQHLRDENERQRATIGDLTSRLDELRRASQH